MRHIRLPQPPIAIKRALVIGNGFAGAESQCIGLVRALGLASSFSLHRVTRPEGGINKWLRWLPISFHRKLNCVMRAVWGDSRFQMTAKGNMIMPLPAETSGLLNVLEADAKQIAAMAHDSFEKEGPLLVIASGRDTIPVASTIRSLASENVFLIQIQHPRSGLDRFDLVITPGHDYFPLTPHAQEQIPWFLKKWITPRENPDSHVILTVGALHQADSAALKSAAFTWHDELACLPRPLVVVNIGGPTRNCRYGADLAKELVSMLQNVLWSCGSLRISFSRRTPEKVSNVLLREFSTNPRVYIWNGEGPNPHMGHLAWADAFVVTADSVSMLSEVCSTGKPVYVAGAELCAWKFADFQNTLRKRGAVRAFTGKENMSDSWTYPPLNDTAEAAAQVHEALAERGWRITT